MREYPRGADDGFGCGHDAVGFVKESREEITRMISWLPYLGSALPQAVERVQNSPSPKFGESSFLYYELSESDVPDRHPVPVAKLLLYALQSGLNPRYDFAQVEDIFKRVAPSADARTLIATCDKLAALGYPEAATLRGLIPGDHQT